MKKVYESYLDGLKVDFSHAAIAKVCLIVKQHAQRSSRNELSFTGKYTRLSRCSFGKVFFFHRHDYRKNKSIIILKLNTIIRK